MPAPELPAAFKPGYRKLVSGFFYAAAAGLLTKYVPGLDLGSHPLGATLPSWNEALTFGAGAFGVWWTKEAMWPVARKAVIEPAVDEYEAPPHPDAPAA